MASGDSDRLDHVELALAEAKRTRRASEITVRMLAQLRDDLLDEIETDHPVDSP